MEPRRTSPVRSLLERIRAMAAGAEPTRPILLVGPIGSGKTSTGMQLISLLRSAGLPPGGILAPRILDGDETVGYSLLDLRTNTTHPFAGLEPADVPIGRFHVTERGLERARRAIVDAASERPVVLVDEIGRLELAGNGHAPAVRVLLASSSIPVLTVRDAFVDAVIRTFELVDPIVYDVAEAHNETGAGQAGITALWRIVSSIPFPLLVTRGEDGFPESRPMTLADREGATVWLATSRSSRKVAEIEADPRVALLFVDSDRFNYAALRGRARLVDDPEREASLWRDAWADDWPEGPADPDYVLLRIDAVRGRYLRGSTGESGTVDLTTVSA